MRRVPNSFWDTVKMNFYNSSHWQETCSRDGEPDYLHQKRKREREGKEDTPNHPSKSFQIGKRSVDRPFVNCRNARHIIRLDRDDSSLLCPALPPPDRMRQHVIFELNLLSGVTHSTGQHSKSFLNYRWSWKLLNWTFPIQKSNKEAKHTGYLRQFESMTRWLRSEKTQNPYR